MFLERKGYLIRGYSADDRIVYGTGKIVSARRHGRRGGGHVRQRARGLHPRALGQQQLLPVPHRSGVSFRLSGAIRRRA